MYVYICVYIRTTIRYPSLFLIWNREPDRHVYTMSCKWPPEMPYDDAHGGDRKKRKGKVEMHCP